MEANEEFEINNIKDKHLYDIKQIKQEKNGIITFLMEYNIFIQNGNTTKRKEKKNHVCT